MSKKWIWILASFMTIIVTGLVAVQAYWIREAMRVKEQQFIQVVTQSLLEISAEAQQRDALNWVKEEIELKEIDTLFIPRNTLQSDFSDTSFLGDSKLSLPRQDDQRYYFNRKIRANFRSSIRMSGEDSITVYSNFQQEVISKLPENTEKGYISPAEPQTEEEKLQNQKVLVERIVKRMTTRPRPLDERINSTELEELITSNLNIHGLNLKFEYAVYNQTGDTVIQSPDFKGNAQSIKYRTQLFPNDPIGDPGRLVVYFPNEKKFVFSSLGMMSYSSLGLSLIIILLFALTIGIIYRQKRLSEMKNDFVNNMTHELKTPISSISLAAQMLSDKSIPHEAKNFDHISSVIHDESKRLGYQVEKVLQMAIFDKGTFKLKQKPADMMEILSQVMNNFTLQIEDRHGEIDVDFEAENTRVFVDKMHITNVVSNLIDNALKYSKDEPRIRIKTWNRDNKLFLSVRDNGIGIKKEDQKRIFEKFYRVPTGNLHNVKGFGLGLSYVKKIVDEHGGNISMRSEFGKGTEFIISLPLDGG